MISEAVSVRLGFIPTLSFSLLFALRHLHAGSAAHVFVCLLVGLLLQVTILCSEQGSPMLAPESQLRH